MLKKKKKKKKIAKNSSLIKKSVHHGKKLIDIHKKILKEKKTTKKNQEDQTQPHKKMKHLIQENFKLSVGISTIDCHLDGIGLQSQEDCCYTTQVKEWIYKDILPTICNLF